MCALDATDFFKLAKADAKVVAISPWNWAGCPTCNGSHWTPPHTCCMDEIGAKDQPHTRAAYFKIADEIIAAAGNRKNKKSAQHDGLQQQPPQQQEHSVRLTPTPRSHGLAAYTADDGS